MKNNRKLKRRLYIYHHCPETFEIITVEKQTWKDRMTDKQYVAKRDAMLASYENVSWSPTGVRI